MGQRHQIYVRLPAVSYGKGNPNNKPERTIGIHHQWLYGWTAVKLLKNYLSFVENSEIVYGKYNKAKLADYAVSVLQNAYSFDNEIAYTSNVHLLNEECEDPRKGDNNNGITVIDLTGDKPKYAFLSIGYLECEQVEGLKVRHPNDPDYGQDVWYDNFVPIDVEHWLSLHYGKDWNTHLGNQGDLTEDIRAWVDYVKSHDLLNVNELGNIFPKMVTEVKGEGIVTTPNTIRFMDFTEKPIVIKSTTKTTAKITKKKSAVGSKRAYR